MSDCIIIPSCKAYKDVEQGTEEWCDIPDPVGCYQVSNLGNVRSVNYKRSGCSRTLKHVLDKNGYPRIHLHWGKYSRCIHVHRLVATAFIPNADGFPQINHKNGIKTDNRVENLEWCTCLYNIRHSINIGLANHNGENNRNAHMTEWHTRIIKRLRNTFGWDYASIMECLGVTKNQISKVICGRTWGYLNG